MCFFFYSHNSCPTCHLCFNNRLNRVPCWAGCVSHHTKNLLPSIRFFSRPGLKKNPSLIANLIRVEILPRHGLRCRSGIYDKEPDEVYRNKFCPSCERRVKRVKLYPNSNTELAGLGYHVARGSGAGCHVQGVDASCETQTVSSEGMASQGVTVEVSRRSLRQR